MGQLTHIDCFSGAGGICTGFKAAGIKTVLAIEKVASCAETYSANHPEVLLLNKDIRYVTNKQIQNLLRHVKKIDIVTSGMPCETFSTAGSKSRNSYDHRQFLFKESIRIAKCTNAKLILFENVPAITSKRITKYSNKTIIDMIYEELHKYGYCFSTTAILNSADFGIPQNRKRFFLLASRDSNITLDHPKSHHKHISIKNAFRDLPKISANEINIPTYFLKTKSKYTELMKDDKFWKNNISNKKLTYHIAPKHRIGTLKRFRLIKKGESLYDLFQKYSSKKIKLLQKNRILPNKWYIQRNQRMDDKKPSITVTSHCLDELIHPHIDRGLTPREVARLQSFPDYYDFKGGPLICPHIAETQDKYEQIGDAVPPLLSYNWGMVIKTSMSEIK